MIVITYPPEHDGELHIDVKKNSRYGKASADFTYTFTHASKGNEWETLVAAAKAIIAQDERGMKSKKEGRCR